MNPLKIVDALNLVAFYLIWNVLKRLKLHGCLVNPPTATLLIILGIFKWHDIPHLHHPLIGLRRSLEEKVKAVRGDLYTED